MACPMPLPPPVIIATLPSKRKLVPGPAALVKEDLSSVTFAWHCKTDHPASERFRSDFQLPELCGVFPKHRALFLWRVSPQVLLDEMNRAVVGSGQGTNWPIRPNHQPLRAKTIESYIQIGPKILRFPRVPIRFCHQARELGINVREASSRIPRSQPSISPSLIIGFARWSSTKRCLGKRFTNSTAVGICLG